jgi:two-component sensor histidine kinase
MMLNFRATSKTYKYISAYKIYDENFNQEIIKDKIVLISSSTSRFRDLRATPYDSTFEAVEIQANTIDNIINSDFLSKPNWVESVDMFFLLILVLLLLKFSMYSAVKNTIFSVTLISGFFIFSFLLFIQFGLILNILFPLVIGFILYAVLTLIEYINEVKLKEKLNTQLISEMKDRQMIIEDEVMQKTYELHKALKDKTTLLRELHHRVKNNLQLILSITRLQQHELKDSKLNEEFSKLQSRIKSIAKTHEILCDNDDISSVNMSQYIGELCEEMESGLMQDNIETDIEINVQVTLPLRQAVYVGLVINEIMSNSIKHAFDEKGGKIYIYLAKQIDEYILRISDDGKRYEKDSLKGGSLGLKLVESLVVSQLEGSIKVQSDNRFGYDIRFKEGEL